MATRLRRQVVLRDLRTRWVGRTLRYRLRTTSTMDDARAAARRGAVAGTVIIAEEQTAGRGTGERSWVAPAADNLYCTIIVRPTAQQLPKLSIVAAVAVANAVEQVTGLYPRIKWPNDLQFHGKKFAGILVESEWQGDRPHVALVGIGLNVNFDPAAYAAIDQPATSLALERGRPLPREPLLAALLTAFERAFEGATSPALLRGWRARLETLGRPITLTNPAGQTLQGTAEDVTEDGALLVRLTTGELRAFAAGEVSSRRPTSAPAAP